MFEKFSPEENNDIESKIEVNKSHSDFVRERLSDPDLSESQRKALREMLIANGIKVNMYKQFDESLHSSAQEQNARIIEMKPVDDEEDNNEDRFRKAI